MLFYCSEHMQKRESNICELDTCSFLRFSLPTNTEPSGSGGFPIRTQTASLRPAAPKKRFPAPGAEPDDKRPEATIRP